MTYKKIKHLHNLLATHPNDLSFSWSIHSDFEINESGEYVAEIDAKDTELVFIQDGKTYIIKLK